MIASKNTVITDETRCPHCTHRISAHTQSNGEIIYPSEGDLTVCYYCKALLAFTEGGRGLRGVTVEEIKKIQKENPELYALILPTIEQTNLKRLQNPHIPTFEPGENES